MDEERILSESEQENVPVEVSMFGVAKRLETAEYELKLLTESVLSGIAKMQYQDGLIIEYANKGLYDILKCTKEEFSEKNQNYYNSVIFEEDWKKLRRKIEANSVTRERFECEYRVRTKARKHRLETDERYAGAAGRADYSVLFCV